jgi:hypothetical protein
MFNNLVKEIKSQLYDRVKSPLAGGFIFAWILWNWKMALALISNLSYYEKISLVENYIDKSGVFFIDLWLCPLLSAIVYIYGYPFFAKFPYEYSEYQKKKLKVIHQRIEDETPITQEEANRLRKVNQEELLKLQIQLDESQKRYKALQDTAASLEEQVLKNSTTKNQVEVNISGLSDGFKNLLSELPANVSLNLTKQIGTNDPKVINVYLALVKVGGRSSVSNLVTRSSINRVQIDFALTELTKNHIVEDYPGGYELTDYGKKIAVDNDLTT